MLNDNLKVSVGTPQEFIKLVSLCTYFCVSNGLTPWADISCEENIFYIDSDEDIICDFF